MIYCHFCKKEIDVYSPVFICDKCADKTIEKNKLKINLWKYAECLRRGDSIKKIKQTIPSTYFFFQRNNPLSKNLLNPVYIMGKKIKEIEKVLFLKKKNYPKLPRHRLTKYEFRYLKIFYGGLSEYKKKLFVDRDWKTKLIDFTNLIGERNLTKQTLKEMQPEIYKKVSKIGMNNACLSCKIEKRWMKWTPERITSVAMREIDKTDHISMNAMRKKFGNHYREVVINTFGKPGKVSFLDQIKRNKKRKENEKKYGINLANETGLIHSVLNRHYKEFIGDEFLYEEMFACGMIGLMVALELFEPEKNNTKWSTYAWKWIRSQVGRMLENQNPRRLIRIPSNKVYKKNFDTSRYDNFSLNEVLSDENTEVINTIEDESQTEIDNTVFLREIQNDIRTKFDKEDIELYSDFLTNKKKIPCKKVQVIIDYIKEEFFD